MIEKVNPMHPDKVADRIAGAVVDLAYKVEENPKIAVEVLIGHGVCHIIAETSAELDRVEVCKAVHRIQTAVKLWWTLNALDRTRIFQKIKATESGAVTMVFSKVYR